MYLIAIKADTTTLSDCYLPDSSFVNQIVQHWINLKIAKQSLTCGMLGNAVKRRIAEMGNVVPSHSRAGISTAVARWVVNSFNETSQCPWELWTSEKNLFETFWTSRSKVLTDSFCCSSYIPSCIGSEVRWFDSGRGRWIISDRKNPEYDFLRKGSKALSPVL